MSSTDAPGGTASADTTTGATPDVPPAKRPAVWKQLIAAAITIAVLVIVFLGIFPKFANYSDAWDAIQEMSVGSLVVFGVFTILNIIIYVFPYQAALPGIGYPRAFIVRQTSFMISNAVPAGGAFGLGVQYAMLNSYGIGPAVASSAIGVTSVWNMLVTLALPALGLLALLVTGEATGTMALGAIGALVALGVVVGVLALVLRSEAWALRIGGWGDSLMSRFRKGQAPDTVTQGVVRFRDQTVDVVHDRWVLLTITNFGQQLAQFSVLAVAIYGLGGSSTGINLLEVFAAFALARLAGFIPITPGGLGTVDAALVGLLHAFGMSENEALAANLLWRAATFIPQVVLGIITFIIWRVQRSRQISHGATPAAA